MRILTLALVLILYTSIAQVSSDNNTILWNKNYDLTLEDFQGVPDDINYADFDGATVAGADIRYHTIGDEYYVDSVRNLFHKNKSWIRHKTRDTNELISEDLQMEDLLIHENLHFDIAELFVRKLRKQYDSLDVLNIRNKEIFDKITDEVILERELFDTEFDEDTEYGKHYLNQLAWEKRVLEQLENYSDYCYEQ